jgi:hypothetical protein
MYNNTWVVVQMRILDNEKLLDYLAKRDKALEAYSEGLHGLNAQFDPLKAQLKKNKINQAYLVGCVLSVIVIFTFFYVLFPDDIPGYIPITAYSIFALLLGLTIFLLARTEKKIAKTNREWAIEYEKISKHRKEGNEYLEKAAQEAIRVICMNRYREEISGKKEELAPVDFDRYLEKLVEQEKQAIAAEIGTAAAAEEIIEYYKNWGKKFTHTESVDNDAFLAARRKRHLGE